MPSQLSIVTTPDDELELLEDELEDDELELLEEELEDDEPPLKSE